MNGVPVAITVIAAQAVIRRMEQFVPARK